MCIVAYNVRPSNSTCILSKVNFSVPIAEDFANLYVLPIIFYLKIRTNYVHTLNQYTKCVVKMQLGVHDFTISYDMRSNVKC